MVYIAVMNIAALVVAVVALLSSFGLMVREWWIWFNEEEPEEFEEWECEECGFIAESVSIEGIVEGIRIHNMIRDCCDESNDYYQEEE
jgi:hypothetical protein